MTSDVVGTANDTPPDDNVLEVRDVVHRYDDVIALNHVSLTVRRGEFLTLLGPSGSGKSTLLRTIAGLETPESVAVMMLNGEDIRAIPANQRDVATVFQHFALFPHMTVGANVEYGLRVRGVDAATRRQRAREALAMVRLESKYDRRVFQLSGGEKQRVALARSLVIEPDILLLDEPLGALDERLRLDMQIELVELHKRTGRTFILVTHSQEEAITMSDRIVLMCKAQIEQISDPQTMFERPETPFAARFMGVENVFEGVVVGGDGHVLDVDVGGTILRGTAKDAANVPARGAPAFVAVRAEHVRPIAADEAPASDETCLQGALQTSVYKGKYRDFSFATTVGEVVARIWDIEGQMTASRVAWPASRCVVGPISRSG